jgi:putative oxidoreductase
MMRRVVEWVLRLGLGGLFAFSGGVKVRDPETFFWDVHHFDLTPWDLSMIIAMFLPWLEIAAGLALITRKLYLGAIAWSAAMSTIFLGAITTAWARGLDITCGCFGRVGPENATNYPQHLALNGAMLAVALILGSLALRSVPHTKKS